MTPSLVDTYRRKTLRSRFLIVLSILVGFSTFIYMPIYYLLESNVIWNDSALLLVWMEVVEPVMHYAFYWCSFAFVFYAILAMGLRGSVSFLLAYAAAAFLKHALSPLAYMWVMGAIHWSSFMVTDFWPMIWSILLDWAQMALVSLLSCLFVRKYGKGKKAWGHPSTLADSYLPSKHLLDRANPIFRRAVALASIPVVLQILSRIYYDLDLILVQKYPFNGAGEILVMVSYYLTDILTAFLGAIVLMLLLNRIHRVYLRTDPKNAKE